MERNERATRFIVTALVLGTTSGATSCLRVNDEHCMFQGGNAMSDDCHCVAGLGKDSVSGLSPQGCQEENPMPMLMARTVPENFAYVKYGIPIDLAALGESRRFSDCQAWRDLTADETVQSDVMIVNDIENDLRSRETAERDAAALTVEQKDALNRLALAITAAEAACGGSSTTGTTTMGEETSTTAGTETDSESSTTGPECMSADECSDPTPFCNLEVPDMGVCVDCEGMPDPHAACAGMNDETPVCHDHMCRQCTPALPNACTGLTPVCDAEMYVCVGCTAHEECGEAACNLFTGACLPDVVHLGPGQTLAEAVGGIMEGTLVLPAGAVYDESVTVNDGQVIAFLAAELGPGVEPPRWLADDAPQLTVNANATVLLDGMELSTNASSTVPGVLVNGGQAWLDRSRIVQNFGGGIIAQNNATLTVRNCFVGDGSNGQHALSVDGSSATVLSTTLGVGVDNFAAVFPVYCNDSVDVTIRNSLLVSFDGTPEISCSSATVTNTASETLIPGMGNVALGPIAVDWFLNITVGDFHLDNPPMNVDATARWTANDPPTDIDGDPRPMRDDTPDFAGADVP